MPGVEGKGGAASCLSISSSDVKHGGGLHEIDWENVVGVGG